MNFLLRSLACALLLAPSLLPAAETQRFVLERPYQVAEIPEPDRNLPATNVILMIGDGMGIHHLSAAWAANRGRLFIENCPVTGLPERDCREKDDLSERQAADHRNDGTTNQRAQYQPEH